MRFTVEYQLFSYYAYLIFGVWLYDPSEREQAGVFAADVAGVQKNY